MTENSAKLIRIEFKNFVPKDLYYAYMDTLYWNDNLYICLINLEDETPKMYLETTKSSEKIIRVFTSTEDISTYASLVCEQEKITMDFVKKWELKFHDLIEYLNKISKKYKKDEKISLKIVGSGFYDEKIIELGVLWSNMDEFIN